MGIGIHLRCATGMAAVIGLLAGCSFDFARAWSDAAADSQIDSGADSSPPRDAESSDHDQDSVAHDSGSEGPPPDVGVDAGNDPPCAQQDPLQTYGPGMVICRNAGGGNASQCDAHLACNEIGGWTLCTATQFLARGGKTTAALTDAWLASCIRSAGAPHAPTDGICAQCMPTAGIGEATYAFACPGAGGANAHGTTNYVGVRAFDKCRRIGVDAAATQGYWAQGELPVTLAAAVCCR